MNDNNLANAAKVGLFHGDTGQPLANDLPLHHADNHLDNGAVVILEKGVDRVNPLEYGLQ